MGPGALSAVLMRTPRARPVGRWAVRRLGPGDGFCAVRGADAGEARPRRRLFTADLPLPLLLQATAGFILDSGGRDGGGGAGGGGARRLHGPGGGSRGPQTPAPARGRGAPPAARGSPLPPRPARRPRLSRLPFPLVRTPGALRSLQKPLRV